MEKSENLNIDEKYMRRAIELALRGEGWTSPNPMVGAVIVKDGRVIGKGWHHRYGELHAERDALKNCAEDPEGAVIYVTLEPCCHHGKQPPCVDAIISSGIKEVIIGSGDPNPLVAGKGIEILKSHGIRVTEGVLENECLAINEVFFHYITTQIPYVAMKYAMTMDGKIACHTGESKWVTGEKAREHVQTLRNRYRGIMVGVGTVLKDDPMLNCRMEEGRDPIRIICDSRLRTPFESKIVRTAEKYETVIATCCDDQGLIRQYEDRGIKIIRTLPSEADMPQNTSSVKQQCLTTEKEAKQTAGCKVDIPYLLKELGRLKLDSILLEGGAQLNWSVLSAGCVNKVYAYIAPKLFGGVDAKSPVAGTGYPTPQQAVQLENSKIIRLGDDFLIESSVCRKENCNVYRHN